MMSRILSGLILMVVMRGAKTLTSARGSEITASILSRMNMRPSRAWVSAFLRISSVSPATLMSIWIAVTPSRVPVTLKSISPRASSRP